MNRNVLFGAFILAIVLSHLSVYMCCMCCVCKYTGGACCVCKYLGGASVCVVCMYMRQYKKLSNFWQGKNIKTSVFRTCILITQNTEQVLRISELFSVIQNSYIYGNHGNLKMELTLPLHSCYQSLTFFRRL